MINNLPLPKEKDSDPSWDYMLSAEEQERQLILS